MYIYISRLKVHNIVDWKIKNFYNHHIIYTWFTIETYHFSQYVRIFKHIKRFSAGKYIIFKKIITLIAIKFS